MGADASGFPSGCATKNAGKPEILIEFVIQGNVAKVTAIDSATGAEASIVGPANAGRDVLAQAAARKLKYVGKEALGERRELHASASHWRDFSRTATETASRPRYRSERFALFLADAPVNLPRPICLANSLRRAA